LNLVVGNDRRIKIWNQNSQLICDYNINVIIFLVSTACLTNGIWNLYLWLLQLKKFTMVSRFSRLYSKNIKMTSPSVNPKISKQKSCSNSSKR